MKIPRIWSVILLFLVLAPGLSAQTTLSLHASAASPLPLGTPVTWTATLSGTGNVTIWYRFRVQVPGGDFRTVVDYGPKASLTWTTVDREGPCQIEVTALNLDTLEESVATNTFSFSPLVSGATPVVTVSANPQVLIYSAPPCPAGGRMKVQFQAQTPDSPVQMTPDKACLAGASMNFYLAGVLQNTVYQIQHILKPDTSRVPELGPIVNFSVPASASSPLAFTALAITPSPPGLLLQSVFGSPALATDLFGNLIWLGPSDITYLTRPVTGGTFLGIGEDGTKDSSQQFIREFDLAGITVAETNAARVSQQLAAMGMHGINAFHHELRKLPDGGYLALADSERILFNVQGAGNVDVIGDTIVVLNQDLEVTWAWDAFDYLDPSRLATLGETCTLQSGIACAPFYLAPTANDWLHGNALQLTPDGNILYSTRHQDWVIKIDYANGAGNGNILWRMGVDGDFQIASSDPYPWFSHQHDSNFESNNTTLLVFDDGNVRQAANSNAHSRGQVFTVDESTKMVTPVLNADLGVYCAALGSAQQLPDGNYHFDAGFIIGVDANGNVTNAAESLEVSPLANIVFGVEFNSTEYRTFRMPDLYTAPEDALRVSRPTR